MDPALQSPSGLDGISCIDEVVCAFGRREFIESVSDCPPEVIDGPGADLAENGFELGEDLFDGIEVRAVGRPVEWGCANRLDGLAYAGDFVGGEVVHDDDVALGEGRDQGLLDPGKEACAADGMIGSRTRAAVRAFQADADLGVDGQVSEPLLRRLQAALD